jgi:hypothetical protein
MKLPITLSLVVYAILITASEYSFESIDLPQEAYAPIPATSKVRHKHEYIISNDELEKYPNITLEYGIHLPTLHNTDAGYVTYKNIRYGQAPTEDLRWAVPKAPEKVNGNLPIFNGSNGRSCYQANPQWATDSVQNNNPDFDWETAFRTETDGDDCLFLDVTRPIEVVEDEKLPVLVWIYGGGFVYGKKDMDVYSPAGFFRRAGAENKFIYVALNYRVSLETGSVVSS